MINRMVRKIAVSVQGIYAVSLYSALGGWIFLKMSVVLNSWLVKFSMFASVMIRNVVHIGNQ